MRILLGDHFGKLLGQVRPTVGPTSWRLNDIGQTLLTFSKTDTAVREDWLQFGNRVLIEFPNSIGYPNWGGIIDPPRRWHDDRVEVTCYTIEYLLQFRETPKARAFTETKAGTVWQYLLQEAEMEYPMGIDLGMFHDGGRDHSPRFHYEPLWQIAKTMIIDGEGFDVHFAPSISNDKIIFTAYVYQQLGRDKSGKYSLKEGKSLSSGNLEEQGPIVNRFATVGAGETWGPDRPSAVAEEFDSIQKYGLRQGHRIFPDITLSSTLERFSRSEAERQAKPRFSGLFQVANENPAKWVHYHIGDILDLSLPSYGFDGVKLDVKVIAREYDPSTSLASVVVEEQTDTRAGYVGTGGAYYAE